MTIWRRSKLALSALSLILIVSPLLRSQVRAWEGTIEIPTYQLGSPDPNPVFPVISRRQIYPYAMLDDLAGERSAKNYRAIFLENDYLKLTILPDLGGRLYSVYDKVDGREVFYRNHVVKYGLIGVRGAWISGGIEFNFPNAHTVTTVSPVQSIVRRNPDGSATAVVGAMDWVSNMHWEVALTLSPGAARVEQRVLLFNSTPLEHLYWFWANAAVKASDDMQYIYPMREALPDDPYGVVETWPVWHGVNQSWYRNLRHATAIFGRQVHRNFFGVYYHQSDCGVVHVSDFRADPGKKIWSWGTAGDGLTWTHLLTDHDGPYNEIQSGRFATQVSREFMMPRRVEQWTEFWYPVRGLSGGFVEANPDMAINVVSSAPRGGSPQVRLFVSPVVNVRGAKVEVMLGPKLLRRFAPVNFETLKTSEFTVDVPGLAQAKNELEVKIVSPDGGTVLEWSSKEPVDGNPDFVPAAGIKPQIPKFTANTPVEQLYLHGVWLEKRGNPGAAEVAYKQALARDPGFIPALIKEAWRSYRAADFNRAEFLIARAIARDGSDPDVHYAAGTIYLAAGRLSLAKDAFWAAIHFGGPPAPSFVELGEIAIRQKDYGSASELLGRALSYNPADALARAGLAVALRLGGRLHEAADNSARAVAEMPLLPQALAEQWMDESQAHTARQTPKARGWVGPTGMDTQDSLDVAAWYRNLGDLTSSDKVLHLAIDVAHQDSKQSISPMLYYYLASSARYEGKVQLAHKYAREAAALPCEEVFPNRITDALVLADASRENPGDAHAQYALGNFLFAHGRYNDASKLWFQALGEGFESAVLARNLGIYAWKIKQDLPAAAGFYRRAIRFARNDFRLYTDLDEIDAELGDASDRARLFHSAPPDVMEKDAVLSRRALFMITQGKFDDALALLKGHDFKPWEGGEEVYQIFVFANLKKGKAELREREPKLAEAAFSEAMKYPKNLGVGKPDKPENAQQLYWLGRALEEEGRASEAQATWRNVVEEGKEAQGASAVFGAVALGELAGRDAMRAMLERLAQPATQPDASAYQAYVGGLAELYRHNDEAARHDFERCLAKDPLMWQARIELNDVNRHPSRP